MNKILFLVLMLLSFTTSRLYSQAHKNGIFDSSTFERTPSEFGLNEIDVGISTVFGLYISPRFEISEKFSVDLYGGYYTVPLTRTEYRLGVGFYVVQQKSKSISINWGLASGYGFNPRYNHHSLFLSPNGMISFRIVNPFQIQFRLGVSFEKNEAETNILAIPHIGIGLGFQL